MSSRFSVGSTISPEESHECLLGLKNDPKSTTKVLYPGSGESHCLYLSHVMQVAVPTKNCLDLVHELLVPVLNAQDEQKLTRQEKSMLIDCEEKIKKLVAKTFENYKSLDENSLTGLTGQSQLVDQAAPALSSSVRLFRLLHDVLSPAAQDLLTQYLQADIKIHNQHIFPSSVDLPKIAVVVYSLELSKKVKRFLTACPPSHPFPHILQLLISAVDFEKDLITWNLRYVVNWIEDTRLNLLGLCKTQLPYVEILTVEPVSPYVEHIYEQIREAINEYEIVIEKWPQYLLLLETAVANVERSIISLLEKQYRDCLMPLKDGIQKTLKNNVKKIGNTLKNGILFTNPNQEKETISSTYSIPPQLGTFMNSLKRIMDTLHNRVKERMRQWAQSMTLNDQNAPFGKNSDDISVMLRKRYEKYLQSIVKKLVNNTNVNRGTKLKVILEAIKGSESESEIRERMQPLSLQVSLSIQNLHRVFCTATFIDMSRGFWDRFGQIVLKFLESKKEKGTSYKGSNIALEIIELLFTSEMQRFVGNALQEVDLQHLDLFLTHGQSSARTILYIYLYIYFLYIFILHFMMSWLH
ncbi:hypothetical protein LUZ60_007876 [Juncus effusus]|nr:hypothetical protein LUZ60_007876 [Juncus effusus]